MTSDSTAPLLAVEEMSWTPPGGDRAIFERVSLAIEPGEAVALTGPSGSGKSTLLRCIVRLLASSQGRVLWRGEEVGAHNVRDFRRQVVYLHQEPVSVADSIAENLAFARERGGETGLDEAAQREMMERVGLGAIDGARDFDGLSGGERQRLCVVRAMTLQPQMLLLDEPTSSLDAESLEIVEAIVAEYLADDDDRAALWVTHDEAQVERVAARRIELTEIGEVRDEAIEEGDGEARGDRSDDQSSREAS